jgi:hypothetical protein
MVALNEPEKEPESVLEWCRNLVRVLADGGVWGIPRSGLVFRVDKEGKRLILIAGDRYNDDFYATKRVFKQIGWGVECSE